MISSPILMWLYFLIFLTMNSPLLNDMLASLVAQMVKLLPAMPGFDPWVGKIPWRRKWQPTSVLLPGKSHGQRSLVGYSPWGHKELDTTEQLDFHFHFHVWMWELDCKESWVPKNWFFWIVVLYKTFPGEGNGNPLQYSCLENPHGQRNLAGYSPWCRKSWTRLND